MTYDEKLVLMVADIYKRPREMDMIIERYISRSGLLKTVNFYSSIQQASNWYCQQIHESDYPQKLDIQQEIGRYCYNEIRRLELKSVDVFLNVSHVQRNVTLNVSQRKSGKRWWIFLLALFVIGGIVWWQKQNINWDLLSINPLISGILATVIGSLIVFVITEKVLK